MDVLDAALRYIASGISVIPIRADGSKAPAISAWKEYQSKIADETTVRKWFTGKKLGIGMIGGSISGGIEILDFDEVGLFGEWSQQIDIVDPLLLSSIPLERTPRGAEHIFYRCKNPLNNCKLAMQPDGIKVRIEMKASGGYAIVYPTPGYCHSSGRGWELISGDIFNPPLISDESRSLLLATTRAFDLATHREEYIPNTDTGGTDKPGHDYCRNGPGWLEILGKHEWTIKRDRGSIVEWARPGKEGPGISATTKDGVFVPYTTSTVFEPMRGYSKFQAYAVLNHNWDFSAAARQLASEGYGEKRKPTNQTHNPSSLSKPQWSRYTDVANAERFASENEDQLMYADLVGGWYWWQQSRWSRTERNEAMRAGVEMAKMIYLEASEELELAASEGDKAKIEQAESSLKKAIRAQGRRGIEAMFGIAKSDPRLAVSGSELDANPMMLNLQNGTLDLETMVLREHRQGDRLTKVAGAGYNPDATSPKWDRYIADILPNDEIRLFVQRYLGYCLTGIVRDHVLPVWYGTGDNGKSVLTETAAYILGDYFYTLPTVLIAPKPNANDQHPCAVAALRGVRCAIASEPDNQARLNAALVKNLTGGDRIVARYMRGDFFEFEPSHKMALVTNHKPVITDQGDGIWRRMALVPFEVKIPEAKKNKNLAAELREEADGILGYFIRGYLDWRERGLDIPKAIQAATDEYRTDEDTLGEFFATALFFGDSTATELLSVLYQEYVKYCEDHKQHFVSKKGFSRMLDERGVKRGPRHGGGATRQGVRLRVASDVGGGRIDNATRRIFDQTDVTDEGWQNF